MILCRHLSSHTNMILIAAFLILVTLSSVLDNPANSLFVGGELSG
jgi:hypothetical protein